IVRPLRGGCGPPAGVVCRPPRWRACDFLRRPPPAPSGGGRAFEEPFGDLLACGDAAGGGDGGAGGAPAGVVEFAVGRADGPVGGPEELGVEERVSGGERRGGAGAAGEVRGGGGRGERVGRAVQLAAVEGGPPAGFGAPFGEVLGVGGRQGGAVDVGVGEEAGR